MKGVVCLFEVGSRRCDDIFLLLPHRIEINQRKEFVTSDQNRKSYPIRHLIDKKKSKCVLSYNMELYFDNTSIEQQNSKQVSSTAGMRLFGCV